MKKGKKGLWCLTVFLCVVVFFGFTSATVDAKEKNIKDGIKIALVYPLSGALARNGNLTVQGIKAAMGWVNDTGGIKSLGVQSSCQWWLTVAAAWRRSPVPWSAS
ncbi:MAG: hypothetical protein ABIG67_05620 [Pseudomonadota bacterium]